MRHSGRCLPSIFNSMVFFWGGVGGFFVCLLLELDVFKWQIVVNRKSVRNELRTKSRDLILRPFRWYCDIESVNESLSLQT